MIFYLPIVFTVVANVCYHLCAKLINPNLPPMAALTATYATATVLSLGIALSNGSLRNASAEHLNWAPFILGASIVLLEFGFIWAYRVGWNFSLAAVVSNVTVGLLLLPISLLFFKEDLSFINLAGIALAVLSLVMMNR